MLVRSYNKGGQFWPDHTSLLIMLSEITEVKQMLA